MCHQSKLLLARGARWPVPLLLGRFIAIPFCSEVNRAFTVLPMSPREAVEDWADAKCLGKTHRFRDDAGGGESATVGLLQICRAVTHVGQRKGRRLGLGLGLESEMVASREVGVVPLGRGLAGCSANRHGEEIMKKMLLAENKMCLVWRSVCQVAVD